ncbi:MAG: chromosome segregation protein [Thermoplasmata archaeon]|jgi:chromosome segregation protein|nr:chromosome segregation protein [Thermoplasmata archaeon]
MHLREVQMENFKSFGRRITVPFEPGFTAITGPNGSGKSNIGDAILFVLGPNSPRAIRAGRLSDLIFNGGEKGKGADHCVVSLVFDNADRTMPVDSDTVTLTRRVKLTPRDDDPDGYSSYFYVNGRASQKKEFIDLLTHARISADGYNITQQGDVLRICTMSNGDRRKILDDIAGVTTFDKDIAAADVRKGEVGANLERIGIVLDEIGRSMAQLEKEKASAAKWRELTESVKRLKGLMAWRRREDAAAQIAKVRADMESVTKSREESGRELEAMRAKFGEAQAKYAELEAKLRAEGGEEVQKLQERIKQARDQMVRLEEKMNFAKGELQTAKEAAQPLADDLRRIEKELEKTRKAQAEWSAAHQKANADLAARRKDLDAAREVASRGDSNAMALNRELSQLKVEFEARQTESHEAKLEADRAAEKLRSLDVAESELAATRKAVEADHKESSWSLKELQKTAGGSGKNRKELEKRAFELRKTQSECMRQAEELEARIRRLQRDLADLRANEEAAARAQGGYGRAVQDVLAARDGRDIKGIIGTVAELAKVDPKHQEAMQIAAAGRLTAVVVEDDAVAAQCIDLVKRKQSGRVTLLPLNKMVPGRPSGQSLMKVKEQGCLGFALDLIEFNPRYQNAFWHVFQDTLVADTMATGRRMMGGVRIVSLDGELFEKSGAMVGGKHAKGKGDDAIAFTNADRGRMDEIMGEVAGAEAAQADAASKAADAAKELADLQTRLAAEGAQDATSEERLKELERKVAFLDERLGAIGKEAEALAAQREAAEAEAAKAGAAIEGHAKRLAELEALRQEKGQLLLKGSRKDLRERIEALDAEVRALTEATLKAEGNASVAATQLALVEARRAEVAAKLDGGAGSETKLHASLKEMAAAYGKAQAEVEALMKMEKKATGNLKGIQDARDSTYKLLTDLKGKMDKVADQMETKFGLIANFRAKLPSLEEVYGEAAVELASSGVTVAPGEEVAPIEDLKREARNAEQALDRLGPVNMTALEQYETQAKRQADLRGEVARLETQRGELETLVTEITRNKKAALMEVFHAVNEQFTQVYAQLTLGGHAHMELENPEEPFAGGLILKAQPMGKKVLRIDALSGGEKSLTSMAFIFAIQRHEPSPFYYFDEVDQNLDAVNSELLAKMVKDTSRFAQFIVVSLRKITLKEASHIYGVTQQSPGQSEIIAHFDIDTLRDEDKPKGGAGSPMDGADGEATTPDPTAPAAPSGAKQKVATKPKPQKSKETTLSDVMASMVQVEVKP